MHGDPYYDENYVWTNGKYICRGGMWIKKKSEIPGFSSTSLPSDVTWGNDGCANSTIKKGRPADTSKYFFLPELGDFSNWSDGSLYILILYIMVGIGPKMLKIMILHGFYYFQRIGFVSKELIGILVVPFGLYNKT